MEEVVKQYNGDLAVWERQSEKRETKDHPKRAGKAAQKGERIETPAPALDGGQAAKSAETEKEIL